MERLEIDGRKVSSDQFGDALVKAALEKAQEHIKRFSALLVALNTAPLPRLPVKDVQRIRSPITYPAAARSLLTG